MNNMQSFIDRRKNNQLEILYDEEQKRSLSEL